MLPGCAGFHEKGIPIGLDMNARFPVGGTVLGGLGVQPWWRKDVTRGGLWDFPILLHFQASFMFRVGDASSQLPASSAYAMPLPRDELLSLWDSKPN